MIVSPTPSQAGKGGPDERRWPFLGLAAFVVLIHAVMFNRDFTVDGLAYATAVESGSGLWHSNHLVFAAIHFAIQHLVQAVSAVPVRAVWTMQVATALCGLGTVLALATYMAPRAGVVRACLLAALLACSFAFWSFSQEPEAYVPPMFCVALSLALLRERELAPGPWRIALLAALAVLAVLLLQQYALWYPALLILLRSRLAPGADRRRALAWVGVGVPVACLAAYLAVGAASGGIEDASGLARWLLGYGYDPDAGVSTYRAAPPLSARALGFALGLGNLLFAYEVALDARWMFAAIIVGIVLLLALFPSWWAAVREASPDAVALCAFLLANALFAFWWESRNIEFLLPLAFAGVALAGLAVDRVDRVALGVAVLGVLSINAGSAFWAQRETPTRYRDLLSLHLAEKLTSRDAVIVEELNTTRWLAYFHGVEPRFLSGAISAAMHGDLVLDDARRGLESALGEGGRVYTFERDEHGRLRALAERFAILGRRGYAGEVETDVERLYDGLTLEPVAGVAGVEKVSKAATGDQGEDEGARGVE